MKTFEKRDASQRASAAATTSVQDRKGTQQIADNRPEAAVQRRQQLLAEGSAQTTQLRATQNGIVQRVGEEDEPDWDNIQGRERSAADADQRGRVPTGARQGVAAIASKLGPALAPRGGPSPLDRAALAQVPEDGLATKAKRMVMGDERSPAERAQAMAAASTTKNTSNRATANQAGLIVPRSVAPYVPFLDTQQTRSAAAGQTAVSHENAEAHSKIKQSLVLKGAGAGVSGLASLASVVPVAPGAQDAIKGAAKLAGAGLSYAGAGKEGQSGDLLSGQAAARPHGLMTMNLAAEGSARSQNAAMGKQQAKSDAVKALIPGAGLLGAAGVDEAVAKAAPKAAAKIADKLVPAPSKATKAAVRDAQADAQVNKERLGAQSLTGKSKALSPEENARIEQQRALAKAAKAPGAVSAFFGAKSAREKLQPVAPRAAAAPAEAAVEPEYVRKARERAERQAEKEKEKEKEQAAS